MPRIATSLNPLSELARLISVVLARTRTVGRGRLPIRALLARLVDRRLDDGGRFLATTIPTVSWSLASPLPYRDYAVLEHLVFTSSSPWLRRLPSAYPLWPALSWLPLFSASLGRPSAGSGRLQLSERCEKFVVHCDTNIEVRFHTLSTGMSPGNAARAGSQETCATDIVLRPLKNGCTDYIVGAFEQPSTNSRFTSFCSLVDE